MIVIIFFVVLLAIRVKRINDIKERKLVVFAIAISTTISLIALYFLQKELNYYNGLDGTIGTDAYRNWSVLKYGLDYNMSFIEFIKYPSYYKCFFWFEYLILWSSPIKTVVILKLANIVLAQNIIVLLYLFLKNNVSKINYRTFKIILLLTAVNGGLIEISIVVFKDILLTYLIIEIFNVISKKKKNNIIDISIFIFLSLAVNSIRPYSLGICVSCYLYQLYINNIEKKNSYNKVRKKFFILIILILAICLIFTQLPFVKEFLDKTNEIAISDVSQDISDGYMSYNKDILNTNYFNRLIIGMLRMVFLPSFFRTLISPIRYTNYNFEGITIRLLELSWQLVYIPLIIFAIYYIIFIKDKKLVRLLPYFMFCIIQFLTYAMLYMGSPQVRWKLLFIIFLNICFGLCIDITKSTKKIVLLISASIFYTIVMFGWGILYLFSFRG